MRTALSLLFGLAVLNTGCASTPDYARPLARGTQALIALTDGEARPDLARQWRQREEILEALEGSATYLAKPSSLSAFPRAGIGHARTAATIERLGQLLRETEEPDEFGDAVRREFEWFKSAGWDGRGGGVLFTGYYTPIFDGRRELEGRFRYPLYSKPGDLLTTADGTVLGLRTNQGRIAYPSRRTIDGERLLEDRDLELVWLSDPMEAYLAHVQGSAFCRLADGTLLRLGFGGTNGRDYTSLAKELVAAEEIPAEHRGVPELLTWAAENPDRLQGYLFRNERYVFFTEIVGTPHGSLDVPVTERRTLATDKSLFPRAAPVVIDARLSTGFDEETEDFEQLAFDQDTGGGIRTAGRADIYVGTGDRAGAIAGRTATQGQLYYLLLKEDLVPRYAP